MRQVLAFLFPTILSDQQTDTVSQAVPSKSKPGLFHSTAFSTPVSALGQHWLSPTRIFLGAVRRAQGISKRGNKLDKILNQLLEKDKKKNLIDLGYFYSTNQNNLNLYKEHLPEFIIWK